MDATGEILFANTRGEELLSLHTEQPQAQLANDARPAPLLSLIVAEMAKLRESGNCVRRQIVTTGDGGRWRLEIVALTGLGSVVYSLSSSRRSACPIPTRSGSASPVFRFRAAKPRFWHPC